MTFFILATSAIIEYLVLVENRHPDYLLIPIESREIPVVSRQGNFIPLHYNADRSTVMSQYSKSSSSSSYTALPFTLDGGASQSSIVFDPIVLVKQIWKGFCLPIHDENKTDVDKNNDEKYEQHFLSGVKTTSVPRCIDLTSEMKNNKYKTSDIDDRSRQRLGSYEFDNCDCNNTTNTAAAIISNDSYDDDDNNNETNCHSNNTNDYKHALDYVDDEKSGHPDGIALTSVSTNRRTRVLKGLEHFISALFVIALTIYMVHRQQQLASQPDNCSFHVHSKMNHDSSFWRWHCK